MMFAPGLLCGLMLHKACGNRVKRLVVIVTGTPEDHGRQRHIGGQRSACGGARGGRCTEGAATTRAVQGAGCSHTQQEDCRLGSSDALPALCLNLRNMQCVAIRESSGHAAAVQFTVRYTWPDTLCSACRT